MKNSSIQPSADVSPSAVIGDHVQIWHLAQVRENATIEPNCIIGRGAYIGSGVSLGENCKVQNYAMLYEPAKLERGVFVGPGVVLTNDTHPRAVNPDGTLKDGNDWLPVGVHIREGASIGARSVCVAPLTIGRWAMVGAGSTVIKDVPDFALMVGSPARRIGWVGRVGRQLVSVSDGRWMCPVTNNMFYEISSEEIREESA